MSVVCQFLCRNVIFNPNRRIFLHEFHTTFLHGTTRNVTKTNHFIRSLSSTTTTTTITTATTEKSARSKFKEIPVNPSLLKYVQSIGVGIPKRNEKRRRLRQKLHKGKFGGGQGGRGEERLQSQQQQQHLQPQRRSTRNNNNHGELYNRFEEMEKFGRIRRLPKNAAPPLPFASSSSPSSPNNNNNNSNDSNKKIIRFPVKLIASVGSSSSLSSTTTTDKFPNAIKGIPEIALAGRSNVGKSTLLNALLYGGHDNNNKKSGNDNDDNDSISGRRRSNRKGPTGQTAKLPKGLKAATSAKPGETRCISFYKLSARVLNNTDTNNDKAGSAGAGSGSKMSMLLVDLPGYGFAYASDEQATQYKSLMESYILDRGKSLKRILLLVDARHGMKMADIEFLEELQNTLYQQQQRTQAALHEKKKLGLPPIQIVLTKCDLVQQTDIVRRATLVRRQLSDCLKRETANLPIMMVSAQMEGQAGVLELQKELAALVPKRSFQSTTTDDPSTNKKVA